MATYYLDLIGGNDANDGTTFANRWKTFASGATAARIAPGDTIRVMKSDDPTSLGQTATWTRGSATVTLTTAVTANITLCQTAWTASANVTCSTNASRKEGTLSALNQVLAAFTTGKAAYTDLGSSIDFSPYEQVSFWFSSNVALSAGQITIDLCSDAIGAVPVNTIAVPAITALNIWNPITVNTGAALGASIRSVSMNVTVDLGGSTASIFLDNILACKSTASADALTLNSLISKNITDETWFTIRSINGTAVTLDCTVQTLANANTGLYPGLTGSVTTYKRETIKLPTTGTACAVQDSGTSGNLITFIGGWDQTNMTTRDGDTWIDGNAGQGNGMTLAGRNFTRLEHFGVVRFSNGLDTSGTNVELDEFHSNNNATFGINVSGINSTFTTIYLNANNNVNLRMLGCDNLYVDRIPFIGGGGSDGVLFQNTSGSHFRYIGYCNYNTGRGLDYSGASYHRIDYIDSIIRSLGDGIAFLGNSAENFIGWIETNNENGSSGAQYGMTNTTNNGQYLGGGNFGPDNRTAGFQSSLGNIYTQYVTNTDSPKTSTASRGRVYSMYEDSDPLTHAIYTEGGNIISDSTTVHTSGISWKISPTSTTVVTALFPLYFMVARVACAASSLVTVSAWMRRDNAGITGKLYVKPYCIPGVTTQVESSLTLTSTWELITITFTPTVLGVVEVYASASGGTTFNVWIDDMTFSQ